MTDRNRTDLGRQENLYRQYIQSQRETGARNAFIDREEEEEYKRRVVQKADASTLGTFVKLAGLGLGAYALGRTIPKDIWVETLHKMGMYGRATFGRMLEARNSAIAGLVDSRVAAAGGRRAERGVELLDYIRDDLRPVLTEIHQTNIHRDARSYAETLVRERLKQRFGIEETGHRITGLTVGDVLALGKVEKGQSFRTISETTIGALKRARKELDPKGQFFDKLTVDSHLFRSSHGRLSPAMKASDVLDTRWASLKSFSTLLQNKLGFQIPWVGFKPIELVTPFFRMGAKRKDFALLARGQTLAKGVVTPDDGMSMLVNGEAIHLGQSGATAIAAGRKFRAHAIDGIAEASLAQLGRHPLQSGKLLEGGGDDSFKRFWGRTQDFFGFGPKYRNEPFAGARLAQAARLAKARRAGATWTPHENIRVHDMPFMSRLRHQLKMGSAYDPKQVISNPVKSYEQLSKAERARASLGFSRLGEFKDTAGKAIGEDTGFLGMKSVGTPPSAYGTRAVRTGDATLKRAPVKLGAVGRVPLAQTAYEDTLANKLSLTGHFITTRLNRLIGATTGMGFRPAMGKWGFLHNMVKIGAIGATLNPMGGYAVDAVKYVNYLFGRVTSAFGYSPLGGITPGDIGLAAYQGVTLAAAGIKDVSGITAGANYLEDLLPGSIQSPLSGMARTIGSAAVGSRFGVRGMLAGLGVAGLSGGVSDIFGTDLAGAGMTTSSSELYQMYTGDRKVRVRSGRWWMFNRSSFYGEGTDRFAPHWVALAKAGPQYSGVQYGSQGEYFGYASRLPTFHNWFGLKNWVREDYFAKKHALDRPYPEAPSGAAMHVGEMIPSRGGSNIGASTLAGAGFSTASPSTYPIGSQTDLSYVAKDVANSALEFLGIYKFMGEAVFGQAGHGPVLANASSITSPNRAYWDQDLGGLFGMTELLRRYMVQPHDINPSEIVNQIPNQMPGFMPGARSNFPGDQNYYRDFTIGDPYTKVKGGEYRLPGAGYEAVNELHSGEPGTYSPVDAFMILSDVAPYSTAYRYLARHVQGMDLSADWQARVDRALQHREEVMKGFAASFTPRRFTGSSHDQLTEINEDIKYSAAEKFIGAQWERATLDVLPEVGRAVPFGTLLTHKLFPHQTAEQDYLERQVYASKFSNWSDPYAGFIRPKALTLYNENPLTAAAGGALMGLTATTPLGMITRGATAGAAFGAASTARAGYYGQLEGGYKPGFRRNEEQVVEYFDKLEYLRYENAKNRARVLGDNRAASQYGRMQGSRTMVGLDYGDPHALSRARGAVPRPERFYFESFMNAPEGDRERILEMVPQYMGDIYKAKWNPGSISRDANAAMADFTTYNRVPDKDWAGWNPGVEKWQLMSRTMDTADNSVAIDMHRQHVSTLMMQQARMQNPNVSLPFPPVMDHETRDWHRATDDKQRITRDSMRLGYSNVDVSQMTMPGYEDHQRWRVKRNRSAERNLAIAEFIR